MVSAWEELAPGVARRRLPGWDATVGAVAGPEGVLVVDAGASLDEGAAVRREVEARFGCPVTHLVLTHPHFDHVLGAGAFPEARLYGAAGLEDRVHGDPEGLREDAVCHGLDARLAAEACAAPPPPALPVEGELAVSLGDRRVVLAYLGPAHTAHDLVVLVPGEGGHPPVVFCGDLVEESGEPQAGPDAHGTSWPGTLDRLLALGGPDARYVPGHGAVVDAPFVAAQRRTLAGRFGD
ncbi:MBL fold metallo-hydrolase [Streptomyces sp. NPDC005438]|uniref:MBL fold metallo-hydrolase n=1 Tax=Streptomyces sp. NPDC005438 TaxID=3156880 RepID=UPI0033B07B2A